MGRMFKTTCASILDDLPEGFTVSQMRNVVQSAQPASGIASLPCSVHRGCAIPNITASAGVGRYVSTISQAPSTCVVHAWGPA